MASSGLIGLLNLGSSALAAQQAGVAVSGRNTANVNTDGYSREDVQLESVTGGLGIGGVTTGAASRADDPILAGNERQASGSMGQATAASSALTDLENALAPQGSNLSQSIASFFAGVMNLSSAPTDGALQSTLVQDGKDLASGFQSASTTLAQARSDSDHRIVNLATEASQLAARIAAANRAFAQSQDPAVADQRDLAARQLAGITGGQALTDPNGMMRFVLGNGQVLVDGTRAATVQAAPSATYDGHVQISVVDGTHTADVTDSLDGGQLAGEVAFRDGTAKTAQNDLDQLAYDLTTQVNAVHSANQGVNGSTGQDFFVQPTQVAGAAAAFAVNPAVAADPRNIASAAPGNGPGDNQGLLAVAALANQPLAAGNTSTFTDEAIRSIAAVGTATAAAKSNLDVQTARSQVLDAARTAVSGVSTADETARLASFQHAAEAAGNFVTTVNDLMTFLMEKL